MLDSETFLVILLKVYCCQLFFIAEIKEVMLTEYVMAILMLLSSCKRVSKKSEENLKPILINTEELYFWKGSPHFIAELLIQQVRKLVLDMMMIFI